MLTSSAADLVVTLDDGCIALGFRAHILLRLADGEALGTRMVR